MTDESIFAAALELPTPEERANLLDSACESPDQRSRLESLLAAHDRAGAFLDRPAVEPDVDDGATRTAGETGDPADAVDITSFLAPSDRPDSLGRIGQYEVLEVLGQGGFGIVYRAFNDKLQRVDAVKVLAPHLAVTSPVRKRFLREARSAAAVDHPNVVRVYAVEEQPLPFLVMEYIPGETLQQKLDHTGPLDVTECVRVGRQIAEGLAAAHAKDLIHRDIKPSNILIDHGPAAVTKITDFGLARAADDASLTRSGAVAGTPMYMAPEQARGETLDHRADLFSLGSVMYQMASGRPPFRANSTLAVLKRVAEDAPRPIREIIPEVPDWFCRIVEKLHAKNPDERFQSAREVADLLADCEKQLTERKELTDTSRIPAGKQTAERGRKGVPTWVWILVAVAGLFVVGCVGVPVVAVLYWSFAAANRPGRPPNGLPAAFHDDSTPPLGTHRIDDGFVSLFNGKDLTGWKEFPDKRGSWTVKDGVLVGAGLPSHLFTERGNLANFHLRMELRVRSGKKAGAIGVFSRVKMEDPGMVLSPFGEGNLYRISVPELYDDTAAPPKPAPPSYRENPLIVWGADLKGEKTNVQKLTAEEWMTYEVMQDGETVTVRYQDSSRTGNSFIVVGAKTPGGHLALQLFDSWSWVEIRKIEIRELPLTGGPADAMRIKGEWQVASPKAWEGSTVRFGATDFELAVAGKRQTGTYQFDATRQELLLKFSDQLVPVRAGYRFDGERLRLSLPGPANGGDPAQVQDRILSINNLKQLGLAAHYYTTARDTLPPPAVVGKNGPLLSWRVALLPHLEEGELYKQFKLDEPWDSEHNKKLIPKMPKIFATPGTKAPDGQTHYRAFTGPGAALEAGKDGKGVRLAEILDGTVNTLLFVEAAEPVVWTKPDDLPFDSKGPLPKLGVTPDGANVVFCDAHTATLAVPVKDDILRGLVTRNGEEKVTAPVKSDEGQLVLECVRRGAKRTDTPNVSPDIVERKKEVKAREKIRDDAKLRVEVGAANKRELFVAEAGLIEAQVKLAETESKADEVAGLLEKLVDQWKQNREFVAVRVNAGKDPQADLDAADARLADAEARLAKARSPKSGTKPP